MEAERMHAGSTAGNDHQSAAAAGDHTPPAGAGSDGETRYSWKIDSRGRVVFTDGAIYAPTRTGGWELVKEEPAREAPVRY